MQSIIRNNLATFPSQLSPQRCSINTWNFHYLGSDIDYLYSFSILCSIYAKTLFQEIHPIDLWNDFVLGWRISRFSLPPIRLQQSPARFVGPKLVLRRTNKNGPANSPKQGNQASHSSMGYESMIHPHKPMWSICFHPCVVISVLRSFALCWSLV